MNKKLTIDEKRQKLEQYCSSSDCITCPFLDAKNGGECCIQVNSDQSIEEAFDMLYSVNENAHHESTHLSDNDNIEDSGERTLYDTGAQRDLKKGKGHFYLMPLDVISKMFDGDSEIIFNNIQKYMDTGSSSYLEYVAIVFARQYYNDIFVNESNEAENKRYDRSRATAILELAKHFENGANKYGEYNWQKGIPTNSYIDSACRHYLKCLRGDPDERHDRAFLWNIVCCIWTCQNRPELNVFPHDKNDKRRQNDEGNIAQKQ